MADSEKTKTASREDGLEVFMRHGLVLEDELKCDMQKRSGKAEKQGKSPYSNAEPSYRASVRAAEAQVRPLG